MKRVFSVIWLVHLKAGSQYGVNLLRPALHWDKKFLISTLLHSTANLQRSSASLNIVWIHSMNDLSIRFTINNCIYLRWSKWHSIIYFRGIRTRIIREEGEHANHLTSTTQNRNDILWTMVKDKKLDHFIRQNKCLILWNALTLLLTIFANVFSENVFRNENANKV